MVKAEKKTIKAKSLVGGQSGKAVQKQYYLREWSSRKSSMWRDAIINQSKFFPRGKDRARFSWATLKMNYSWPSSGLNRCFGESQHSYKFQWPIPGAGIQPPCEWRGPCAQWVSACVDRRGCSLFPTRPKTLRACPKPSDNNPSLWATEQTPSSKKATCLTLEPNGVVDDLQRVSHSVVFSHLHLPAVCGEQ